jgi:chromosome segregation ATPase
MDANAEQSDARAAADAAATAAQAEVARAAVAADAQAAENASLLAGILQAIRESNDKIESLDRKFDTKFDTLSSSIDGLNLKTLSTVSEGFTADLNKVTRQISTTDGRLSSLQSKYGQIQTSFWKLQGRQNSLRPPEPSEADPLPVRPVAPAPVYYGS